MAFDFPASPTVGQAYTLNGVSYVWNGYAWMQSGGAGDVPYLPLTGGTISGDLVIDRAATAGSSVRLSGNGLYRWAISRSATATSDFVLSRFNDAGAWIDDPFSINRATGAATFSGTTRYNTAGSSSGTTIDNMASRLKMWANWHGNFNSVPTLRESLNVTSIGDGGVGIYTMNFTSTLSPASPSVIPNFTRTASWVSSGADVPIYSATSVRVSTIENAVNIDPAYVNVLMAGTLA